ncbi:MAG: hypothetical protein MUP03_01210 [Anaerolineales bacterium]|nr:hypothetical protein [Anaerolineales bacterium]
MNPAFQYDHYLLKRQVFALTGKFRFYNPSGILLLFSEQKMFKLKEDIRLYCDETTSQELLQIKARQIIDFSAAYDVLDSATGQKIGAMRRKGFRSMVRDEWDVMDASDLVIGKLFEDNISQALLRRFLFGGYLLPQNYDISMREQRIGDLKQRLNLFRYELILDFSMDSMRLLDRRLGIAAGILLAAIEGRQQ